MDSSRGHLLIAPPGLRSPAFARTVMLLLDHDAAGATGVILNRPTHATVTALAGKLFEEGFAWDKPLLSGGPTPGSLTVLHALADLADREVIPGVYQTREATKVQHIISRKPEPSLIIANQTAWGPGQLAAEFAAGAWLSLPAQAEHVFWAGPKDLWRAVLGARSARRLATLLRLGAPPPDPCLN